MSFAVSSGWNRTYNLPAHSLERTVCLFPQQGISKKIGNKGGEELYLTKRFIMKTKKNFFYQAIAMKLLRTLSSDFHNDTSNF